MAAPFKLEAYPNWMMELANDIEQGARERVYSFPNASTAAKYRRQLYGFRNALERSGGGVMYPQFRMIRLVIRGSDLHVLHADAYTPKPTEKPVEN